MIKDAKWAIRQIYNILPFGSSRNCDCSADLVYHLEKLENRLKKSKPHAKPITYDEYVNICTELADQYFPKGKCKERGQMLVFIAELAIKLNLKGVI
jgi:hypothetical protein